METGKQIKLRIQVYIAIFEDNIYLHISRGCVLADQSRIFELYLTRDLLCDRNTISHRNHICVI